MIMVMAITGFFSISQTIIAFIIVLGLLIFFHELGHYLAAKRFGILVEEFALGFGPRLFSRQGGETVYSLRAFPLGGFCKMAGEMPHEEDAEADPKIKAAIEGGRCFYQKPALHRFIVIVMGPLMNVILAFLLFSLIFTVWGLPVDMASTSEVGDVVPNRPAVEAGLRPGDRIVAISDQAVETWEEMAAIIERNPEVELELKVQRRGDLLTFNITPRTNEEGCGEIGIYPALVRERIPFWQALNYGLRQTWGVTAAIIMGFVEIITRQAPAEVGGVVRIAQMVGDAARVGLVYLINFTAFISINLAIINLFPIPALDGGRLLFLLVELIRGKAIDPEKEGIVHFIGFILLLILISTLIVRDITQIFLR